MYSHKYGEFDDSFKKKQEKIRKKTSIIQIFKYLDSKRKYWLISNEDTFEDDCLKNNDLRPYNDAIKELEKIQFCNSPREKLKCTMMMRSMMRSGVIDFHKGREELASMDDELPVVIYIVLTANVPRLFTELQFVEDFIYLDPTIETENRFVTNIKVISFIEQHKN